MYKSFYGAHEFDLVKLVHIFILAAIQLEPQVSELTATFLCRTMRVQIPPSLLLQTDRSFKKFNFIYINVPTLGIHLNTSK